MPGALQESTHTIRTQVRVLQGSERLCGWVRGPSSGTGLHQWVHSFKPELYQIYVLATPLHFVPQVESPGLCSHTPVVVLVGVRAG